MMKSCLSLRLLLAGLISLLNIFHTKAQLEFVENQGQWPKSYGLCAKLSQGDFWLAPNQVAFVLSDFGSKDSHKHHPHGNPENANNHCYKMHFEGASSQATISGGMKKETYHNYYLGKDPANWKTHVSLFSLATHQNLYPGIDLIWKEQEGKLKYEFELAPGADPNKIRVRYEGLNSMKLLGGNLVLKTSLGTITEQKPIAFQIRNGKKIPVPCQFHMAKPGQISFQFPKGYHPALPLVIDPVLVFSGFSGSRSDNWGFTATPGEGGRAYAAGIALGTRFPVTPGAFSGQFSGDSVGINAYSTYDIGILKFSSNGGQLLYATYLGGREAESPSSIVVDNDNNLVVLGATGSNDFPVSTNPYDNSFNGGTNLAPYGPASSSVRFRTGSDLIIAKFSPEGTQLLGSTYFGGSANDGILTLQSLGNSPLIKNYGDSFRGEVTIDSANRIYVVSHTSSTNFPTIQALQTTKGTGADGICARFSANLGQLEFSTFLGGNGEDGAFSVQVNPQGRVFVSGGTSSSNFRVSTNAVSPTFKGQVDGFICSFIPGQGLASYRGTFLGTTAYDQSYFVQLDKQGNVYAYGQTLGNYPVTSNVYSNSNSSQFIHCLNATLDSTRFSTVFGSGTLNTNISPTAFLVDDCGSIYCSGWGGSTNNIPDYQNGNTNGLPTTPGAFSQTTDGSDFYIIVLSKGAQELRFATYFGSPQISSDHVDGGTSRFDKKGVVYQSVCAGCGGTSNFPVTPGVYSPTNPSGNCNNAIFKYDFSLLKAQYQPSVTQGCAPLTITFQSQSVFATEYRWTFGSGNPIITSQDTISHVFDSAGTFSVKLVAINPEACPGADSLAKTIVVQKAPGLQGDSLSFCSLDDTLQLPSLPSGNFSYEWVPSTFLNQANGAAAQVQSPNQSIVYSGIVRTTLGCTSSAQFKISNGILKAKAVADTLSGCKPLSIDFSSASFQGARHKWYFGDGDSLVNLGIDAQATHLFLNPGTYKVRLMAFNDTTCLKSSEDSLTVVVFELPVLSDTLNRFCNDGNTVLKAARNRGVNFAWSPGSLLADSTQEQPTVLVDQPGVFSLTILDSNQCKANARIELRDGRLKANLAILNAGNLCAPQNLQLQNNSLNAQKSRFVWGADSIDVEGSASVPLAVSDAGQYIITLKVFSDTACVNLDQTTKTIVLGGIKSIPTLNQGYCPGDTVVLQSIKKPGYRYLWESPAFPLTSDSSKGRVFRPADTILVRVALLDSFQCTGLQTFQLIPQKPEARFETISRFDTCLDILNYEFRALAGPDLTYSWKIDTSGPFSGSAIQYRFPERKAYRLQLIASQNQCRDTLTQTVPVFDAPLVLKAGFSIQPNYNNCIGLPVVSIKNESIGADRFIWKWDGNTDRNAQPKIPIRDAGNLTVQLLAYKGLCLSDTTLSVDIQPIAPPNLITPNADGKNDRLIIENLPGQTAIEIRNRWGQTIFSSDNYGNNWEPDGTFDTGFYVLKLPSGEECRSWLQVFRK